MVAKTNIGPNDLRDSSAKIKVSQEVYDGLVAVRDSGAVNMFNRNAVAELARKSGFRETHNWIVANGLLYGKGVLNGFEVE
jgi:hypothetical protein